MHHAGRTARPERAKEGGASHPIMEREPVCDRVVLRAVRPGVEGVPPRRVAGEAVEVEAEVFAYGDEVLGCALRVLGPGEEGWSEVPMVAGPGGCWQGRFEVPTPGLWLYDVAAWVDDFASWQRRVEQEGARAPFAHGASLLERASALAASLGRGGHARVLRGLAGSLCADGAEEERLRLALDPELGPLVAPFLERGAVSRLEHPHSVRVAPAEGAALAWCDLADSGSEGSEVLDRLPRIAALGFDAVVLPGAALFEPPVRSALAAVREQGLIAALRIPLRLPSGHRLALDQPTWFREAGEAKAEIEIDWTGEGCLGLWRRVAEAIEDWAEAGVEAFYCAEPVALPPGFWEWLPAALRARRPRLAFWAPAPDRPEVAEHLRRSGVTLYGLPAPSWTSTDLHRAWEREPGRATVARELAVPLDLTGWGAEDTGVEPAGRVAVAALVLAATGSASYGLVEGDLTLDTLSAEQGRLLARLNQLRRERTVFGPQAALRLLPTEEPEMLCYASLRAKEPFFVVLCLDEARPRAAWIDVPLAELRLKEEAVFHVEDLLTGVRYLWQGRRNSVRIEPGEAPAKVLRLVR